MWAQTFVCTCYAFVNPCNVRSYANQLDGCTQYLLHAGHDYTEKRLVIQCASQFASPLPVRQTVRGLSIVGTLRLQGARSARHGVPRCCIQQRRRRITEDRSVVSQVADGLATRRHDVVDLLRGTSAQPMADQLGFWAYRLDNAFPADMRNRLVILMHESFDIV